MSHSFQPSHGCVPTGLYTNKHEHEALSPWGRYIVSLFPWPSQLKNLFKKSSLSRPIISPPSLAFHLPTAKMIGQGKLFKIARKGISLPKSSTHATSIGSSLSPVADKGHFVVYTADQRRFMFPMSYLNSIVFRELLAMSEEEFGLPGSGPITLPCDAVFMEYAVSLIKQRVDREMEKALFMSIDILLAVAARCLSAIKHNRVAGTHLYLV